MVLFSQPDDKNFLFKSFDKISSMVHADKRNGNGVHKGEFMQ